MDDDRRPAVEAAPNPSASRLDRRWHLATEEHEIAVTELEYALMRAAEAFTRWQSEALASITGLPVSGSDNAILHIIRMKDRPKSIRDIARLMNRDDIANIQYTIRKLTKAGLIEKDNSDDKRNTVSYSITQRGREVTDDFTALRRDLLLSVTRSVDGLDNRLNDASRTLDLLSGIHEQAARIAATHREK